MTKCAFCQKKTSNKVFCSTKCSNRYHSKLKFVSSERNQDIALFYDQAKKNYEANIVPRLVEKYGVSRARIYRIIERAKAYKMI